MRHQPDGPGAENWWVVLDEILEQMRKNGVGEDQYTEKLSGLAMDASAGEVLRDYAIQHLGQWLAPSMTSSSSGEADESKRKKGLETIVSAIKDPTTLHTTVLGTGLLTLADASERLDPDLLPPLWDSLSEFVSSAINGRLRAQSAVRASAIQFAARTGQRH